MSAVGVSPLRLEDVKAALNAQKLVQTPRFLSPKSRRSLEPPSDITPEFQGQVYKRSKSGHWSTRFLVRGSGKLQVYRLFPVGPVKHSFDLRDVTATVLGQLQGRYYAFIVAVGEASWTYGCVKREECLQWVRRLSSGASFSPMDDINEAAASPAAFKPHPLPVQLQEGMSMLHSPTGWSLISPSHWRHGRWIKSTIPLKSTADEILELLTDKRCEWDASVVSLRTLVQIGPTKLVLEGLKEFTCVLLTALNYEPPGVLYLLQDSVRHTVYAKTPVAFTDCYEIKQHPVLPKLTLLTRITCLKLPWRFSSTSLSTVLRYHDSLTSIKSHIKIKRFFKNYDLRPPITHIKRNSVADTPLPSPRNSLKKLRHSQQISKEDFFVYGKGGRYERDEVIGGLVLTDQELLARQRDVLSYLIRNMGANLLKGKSVMNVSLPVNIFCPESLLQRMCKMFAYAPEFLNRAAQCDDPVERIKLVTTFVVSMIHLSIEQKKPFNPILGETLQGYIGDWPVYAEQTSHHPPVGSFQYYGPGYVLEGSHEFVASTSTNAIHARQKGTAWVKFKDCKVYFSLPTAVIGGIMFGKRSLNQQGVLTVIDPTNSLFSELHFNPDRKGAIVSLFSKQTTLSDTIRGTISRIPASHPVFDGKKFKGLFMDGMNPMKIRHEDAGTVVGEAEGCWLTHLKFDGEEYWNIETYRPWSFIPPEEILPSDSSLRTDLRKLAENDEEAAQTEKERLEVLQRHDRTLRARKH